ncbi:MAG TPA: group II intron maturase-specific domain-containing protein [Candidatus Binatia bacterium]|nr:group II intron maturase-specific domain-containing protein [Candidatus Binatia bacterium]
MFVSFAPAGSNEAAKGRRQRRRGGKRPQRTDLERGDLARWVQPVGAGWGRYYGRFYPSALYRALRTLDRFLVRGAQRKSHRLRGHRMRAWNWLNRLKGRQLTRFPHWHLAAAVGQ